MAWLVSFELHAVRQIRTWPRQRRDRLEEVVQELVDVGPLACVSAPGAVSWEDVQVRIIRTGFASFHGGAYGLRLEIHPGRALVIREVEFYE